MGWADIDVLVAKDPPSAKEAQQVLDYLARRAKARFYADENFPTKAVMLLRRMGAQVRTAQEINLIGHPDENHAAFALKNRFVLLSCDRDFLDERRFPIVNCPAIFVFNFGSGALIEMRQAFRCLASVFRTPQFFDKWWKVDASRDQWTEFVRYQNGSTARVRCRLWRGRLQQWCD